MNGIPTCLDSKAQNGFLRKKLGWDGMIVSDCDAIGDAFSPHNYSKSVQAAAASGIKAGCDLDCGSTYKSENLKLALSESLLELSDIDTALGRVMRMRMRYVRVNPSVPYQSSSSVQRSLCIIR